MKAECPVCHKRSYAMQANVSEGMCERCGDTIEFGYPSFPAYRLEESPSTLHDANRSYDRHEKIAAS